MMEQEPVTLFAAANRLVARATTMERDLGYCLEHLRRLWDGPRLENGEPNLACVIEPTATLKELQSARSEIRKALAATGHQYDPNGHRIVEWPERGRLVEVATKLGMSPEALQQKCEETAERLRGWTAGDVLDGHAEMSLYPPGELITFTQAYAQLLGIVNEISDWEQFCRVPKEPGDACAGGIGHRKLWELRAKIRQTLLGAGGKYDFEGHRIVPWPETERLQEVAAKCGDRTPEKLQAQCEELAGELGMTAGDALDYVAEMVKA